MPMRTPPPACADVSGIAKKATAARSHALFPLIVEPPLDQPRVARPPPAAGGGASPRTPRTKTSICSPNLWEFYLPGPTTREPEQRPVRNSTISRPPFPVWVVSPPLPGRALIAAQSEYSTTANCVACCANPHGRDPSLRRPVLLRWYPAPNRGNFNAAAPAIVAVGPKRPPCQKLRTGRFGKRPWR